METHYTKQGDQAPQHCVPRSRAVRGKGAAGQPSTLLCPRLPKGVAGEGHGSGWRWGAAWPQDVKPHPTQSSRRPQGHLSWGRRGAESRASPVLCPPHVVCIGCFQVEGLPESCLQGKCLASPMSLPTKKWVSGRGQHSLWAQTEGSPGQGTPGIYPGHVTHSHKPQLAHLHSGTVQS